jgi:AraC-like DNA-binding protein
MQVECPPMNKRATATLAGMEVIEVQVPANVSLPTSRQQLANITMFWEGEVLVEEPDRPPIHVGKGEALYQPPLFACAQRFVTDCTIVTIEIQDEKISEFFRVLVDPPALIRIPTGQLGHITESIRRELHEARCGRSIVLASLVTQLIVMGARSAQAGESRCIPDYIRQAREILRASYATQPPLGEIAMRLGLSREHLARQFHSYLGLTVSEFVRSVRIDRVKELLTDQTLSLSYVALRAGFYDQSHMTRTFKMATGMTPRQYGRSLYAADTRTVRHRLPAGGRMS